MTIEYIFNYNTEQLRIYSTERKKAMPRNKFTCDCHAINHNLVQATLVQMPEEAIFQELEIFYKLLGDSTRCKIVFALMENEMCVCDLSRLLNMTKSAVSHQLSKMRNHGVLKCRREGKEVYYSLDDAHVAEIFGVTLEHIRHRITGV